jgi:hypothetical protein
MARLPANAPEKAKKIQQLVELIQDHRTHGRELSADSIQALLDDVQGGVKDANDVRFNARVKLQKYAGHKLPGSIPVEIQEFLTEG